jgi:hypothetical protein
MNTPQYIPSFYFYKFAQGISAPYTELAAYSAGAIDSSGNVLKAESSIDSFEYLIIKLKKIFEQLPAGLTKAQLTNYLSTLQLFSESVQAYDISDAQFAGLVEGYIALNKNPNTSYIALCEDMGVGGGGGGAGTIGTPVASNNQGGVGGFDPVMAPMQRRKPPVGLDNCEMFDVCPEEMRQFKGAKAWKHLPASETKTYLQRYQARNPKGKIALRSIDADTGAQDIHWINYPTKSFAEEYHLGFLDILNEKNTGEVEEYQDSEEDDEVNVATARNSAETPAPPLDISAKELKLTADIAQTRYQEGRNKDRESAQSTRARRQAKKVAQAQQKGKQRTINYKEIPDKDIQLGAVSGEKYGLGVALERSIARIPELLKRGGSRAADMVAQWHGSTRRYADRSVTSREPIDFVELPSIEEIEAFGNSDTSLEDMIKRYDAKTTKATSPLKLDPELFKDVVHDGQQGFPRIDGEYAHKAQANAKATGNVAEEERIRKNIIGPFIQNKQVQEILQNTYRTNLTQKQQDTNSQIVLATRPGQELIPIGEPELNKVFRRGIRTRLSRGGNQSIETSYVNMQPNSNLGIVGVGSKRDQKPLPEQDPNVVRMVGGEVARNLGRWLRGSQ